MSEIDDLANRIQTNLVATDAPGTDVRFTMNRDAATAFMEQLRATSRLLEDHERLRASQREFEIVRSASRLFERAAHDWQRRAEAAEAALHSVKEQTLEEAIAEFKAIDGSDAPTHEAAVMFERVKNAIITRLKAMAALQSVQRTIKAEAIRSLKEEGEGHRHLDKQTSPGDR